MTRTSLIRNSQEIRLIINNGGDRTHYIKFYAFLSPCKPVLFYLAIGRGIAHSSLQELITECVANDLSEVARRPPSEIKAGLWNRSFLYGTTGGPSIDKYLCDLSARPELESLTSLLNELAGEHVEWLGIFQNENAEGVPYPNNVSDIFAKADIVCDQARDRRVASHISTDDKKTMIIAIPVRSLGGLHVAPAAELLSAVYAKETQIACWILNKDRQLIPLNLPNLLEGCYLTGDTIVLIFDHETGLGLAKGLSELSF